MFGALWITVTTLMLLSSGAAGAFDSKSPSPVNVSKSGIALRGYDPVAYVTLGKPTIGRPDFAVLHEGTTYHFVSADHREAFLKEPKRFAPQYGGFCAYAAGHGYKADADPRSWKIIQGRLYVNYNAAVGRSWAAAANRLIAKGDANWSKIRNKAPYALAR